MKILSLFTESEQVEQSEDLRVVLDEELDEDNINKLFKYIKKNK